MNALWHKVCTKAAIWLIGEILLSLIGLDTLADYGEFLLEQAAQLQNYHPPAICLVSDPNLS